MTDTRRSDHARRRLEIAERRPVVASHDRNEYANLERAAGIRQARETVRRAELSEQTFDSGWPRPK